ncbi:MAG: hypothetical protein HYX94_02475 [Chloroflexi bacterium]|nr:hypothetical protein [Chloroflexota bacterium]
MGSRKDKGKEEEEDLTYRLMAELEQLESLREDMQELGVTSLIEVEVRIAEIHLKLDAME